MRSIAFYVLSFVLIFVACWLCLRQKVAEPFGCWCQADPESQGRCVGPIRCNPWRDDIVQKVTQPVPLQFYDQ